MRVKIYRNLHKKCWSVVNMNTGRVCRHEQEITVRNPKFHVQPAGRRKVLETKRKNVHAYITGYIDCINGDFTGHKIVYNPYLADKFIDCTTGDAVEPDRYTHIEFTADGCYGVNYAYQK